MVMTTESYDEDEIMRSLLRVLPRQRTLFAAACAERLFSVYGFFVRLTKTGNEDALREALDFAWTCAGPRPADRVIVESQRDVAESLVPNDFDDDWHDLSPLAQNAAAAVAYALRACLSADAQDGVWAARQIFEVADFLAEADSPAYEYRQSTGSPVEIEFLVAGIGSALEDCGSKDPDSIRSAAIADSNRLLALVS